MFNRPKSINREFKQPIAKSLGIKKITHVNFVKDCRIFVTANEEKSSYEQEKTLHVFKNQQHFTAASLKNYATIEQVTDTHLLIDQNDWYDHGRLLPSQLILDLETGKSFGVDLKELTQKHYEYATYHFQPDAFLHGPTTQHTATKNIKTCWVNYGYVMTDIADFPTTAYNEAGLAQIEIREQQAKIVNVLPFLNFPENFYSIDIAPDRFFRYSENHLVLFYAEDRKINMYFAHIQEKGIELSQRIPHLSFIGDRCKIYPSPDRKHVIVEVSKVLPGDKHFDYRIGFHEYRILTNIGGDAWIDITDNAPKSINKFKFDKWLADSDQFIMKDDKSRMPFTINMKKVTQGKSKVLPADQQTHELGFTITANVCTQAGEENTLHVQGAPLVDDGRASKLVTTMKNIFPNNAVPSELLDIITDYECRKVPELKFMA